MRNQLYLLFLPIISFINTEERLFWLTKDLEIKTKISVPNNLPEGKEENRVLPWVFHDNEESKIMKLNCIMRGYNASNNPINYKEARWSYPGFWPGQVDTRAEPKSGYDGAVPYRIWPIEITTSAADAGRKWATCEFQQGDFPKSTDFKFLIFRKLSLPGEENVVYGFGFGHGFLDYRDLTPHQVEDDIKKQISEHYDMPASSVTRSPDGQKFLIKVSKKGATPQGTNCPTTTPTVVNHHCVYQCCHQQEYWPSPWSFHGRWPSLVDFLNRRTKCRRQICSCHFYGFPCQGTITTSLKSIKNVSPNNRLSNFFPIFPRIYTTRIHLTFQYNRIIK